VIFAHSDHELDGVEDVGAVAHGVANVDKIVVERGCIHQWRKWFSGWVGTKATGAISSVSWCPLHRGTNTISVIQPNVVPHAYFVSIVHDGGAWHRQQQTMGQLDTSCVILHLRRWKVSLELQVTRNVFQARTSEANLRRIPRLILILGSAAYFAEWADKWRLQKFQNGSVTTRT
jgi:hypothetical protein